MPCVCPCVLLFAFSHRHSRERLACPQQQDNGVRKCMLCLEVTSFIFIATNYPKKKSKGWTFLRNPMTYADRKLWQIICIMWDLNGSKCCSCSQPAGGRKISFLQLLFHCIQSIFGRPQSGLLLALDKRSGGRDCVGGS